MKTELTFTTKEQAVKDGFNFAGKTNDETMPGEIQRDLLAAGYSQVVFVKEVFHTKTKAGTVISYWTKHPAINP